MKGATTCPDVKRSTQAQNLMCSLRCAALAMGLKADHCVIVQVLLTGEQQFTILRDLSNEFQSKYNYRYSHEPYGCEKDTKECCMQFVAGVDVDTERVSVSKGDRHERKAK